MKVAFLTTDNRDQLKEYGAPTPAFGPAPDSLLQGLALLPEVEVHIISCARAPLQSPERVAPNLFFHSLHVPKIGWMRTLFQGCVRAVRRKLQSLQPDIVHGQGTEGHNALAAVFSGFPNVCTIHGNMRLIARVEKPPPFSYNWLAAHLEAFTLPRTAGVVCISRHTQRAVADLARRTWLVPNAVDPSFYEVQARPDPRVTPRILCVGRICLLKNQNALIQALDPLARKYPFELRFLGPASPDQPYGAEFFRLLQERPWCTYAGVATRAELQTQLREAALLVLASLEDNCPMVILEAMAAGVPVVAGKIGGIPDLIEEGQTGLFCNPQDAESIRRAVEQVLASPPAAAEMARRAQRHAQEHFHPKAIALQHLEIYREVLAHPPV